MATEQTTNAPTNVETSQTTPVSFSDVSLDTLQSHFNDTYKVSKGSSSQIVIGFRSMSERLQEPTNEYQQVLYPRLKQLCTDLYVKYSETFLTTFSNDTQRQVFGANLNGNRNTGSLYRSIPSGVNKNLSYNYAQFGQLVRVLTSRLRFIVQRDASNVQRYKNSTEEFEAYQKLQSSVQEFMTFVETLSTEWNKLVTETRTQFAVTENQEQRPQRPPREQREQREPRQPYQQREPRQPYQPREPREPREQRPLHQSSEQRPPREQRQPYQQREQRPLHQSSEQRPPREQRQQYQPSEQRPPRQPREGEWQTVANTRSQRPPRQQTQTQQQQ